MKKLEYSNFRSWPENLNLLENYVKEIIRNQNEIIEWIEEQKKKNNDQSLTQ